MEIGALDRAENEASNVTTDHRIAFADTLLREYIAEVGYPGRHNWRIDPDLFTGARTAMSSPPDLRAALAAVAVERLVAGADMRPEMPGVYALRALLPRLLLRNPPFRASDIDLTLDALSAYEMTWTHWVPLGLIAKAIETWAADRPLPDSTRGRLRRLCELGERRALGASERAGLDVLERLLGEPVDRPLFDLNDDWGDAAQAAMAGIESEYAHLWRRVIEHAATATASKPSAAWLKRARPLIEGLGRERFARLAAEWLRLLQRTARGELWTDSHGRVHLHTSVAEHNGAIIKGIAWMCAELEDRALAAVVADAAVVCFAKLPAVGARCTKGGNACIVALGAMPGMDAVAQLVRLRQRIALSQARRLVDGALDAAAAREGLTRDDLEDLAVPTFDLTEGRLRRAVGSFCAELAIGTGGRCAIAWFDAVGKPRKSVPAEVKREYAGELNEFKRLARDIETMLAGQRLRIERCLMFDREWDYHDWRTRLFNHPLLAALTRRLIWSFTDSATTVLGCWLDGRLVGIDDEPLPARSAETRVRLFRPIHADAETTRAWQLWLESHRVTQPFKQAHRELYRLTEAERVAELHSARFAGHLLDQSQFAALCRQRGWTYTLQSPMFYTESVPTLELTAVGLKVEFAVEAIDGPYEEVYSSTGLSLYVMTGLVSFRRKEGNAYLQARLDSIPPALFSEVMRDIDLFTGVSSVGVDPNWRGLGDGRYADYWQQIAFGELSESAQDRRALLERLLPALAIAPRCTLTDRALVIRGDIRTYRIHLGSGNILMQPNFDYLCIVRKPAPAGEEIYLPFEGDATLSLILSKAMLLANDTAITDPTILRQLRA